MPEQGTTEVKDFRADVPQRNDAFFLNGSGA